MKTIKLHLPEETVDIKYEWKSEPLKWIYSHRRGDKYYFKNSVGFKMAIKSSEFTCKFIKGEEYEIDIEWE